MSRTSAATAIPESKAPGFSRRRFFSAAAATVAAAQLGVLGSYKRLHAMTTATAEVEEQTGSDIAAIRPFRVNVPESELTELRRRIKATRWPERETVTDDTQGVQLATIQKLA